MATAVSIGTLYCYILPDDCATRSFPINDAQCRARTSETMVVRVAGSTTSNRSSREYRTHVLRREDCIGPARTGFLYAQPARQRLPLLPLPIAATSGVRKAFRS